MRARDDRGGDAAGRGYRRGAGSLPCRPGADHRSRRPEGGPERARRGRGPEDGSRGAAPRTARARRGPGVDGVAGHRRRKGEAQAARRVLLHRRRTRLDRHAARARPGLRLQSLHPARHALGPWGGNHRHGRGARRPGEAGGGVCRGGGEGGRHHHHRRRVGRRGRLRQAADGQAGRSAVLENRHAPRPANGLRQDRQGNSFRAARQSGRGDGDVPPVCARCFAGAWRANGFLRNPPAESRQRDRHSQSPRQNRVPARRAVR